MQYRKILYLIATATIIALVYRDKLNSVVKIFEKYLGEEPVVLPIS